LEAGFKRSHFLVGWHGARLQKRGHQARIFAQAQTVRASVLGVPARLKIDLQ
jgi:hypothetical protein